MTFITHGLVGAGIRAASAKALGLDGPTCIYLANLGMIEGMAPDVADWLAWKVFKRERWQLYGRMHTGNLRWIGLIFWGYGAHVISDIPFHQNPGEDWWPRLWWLEVAYFALAVVLLGWTFAP